jgi:RNA polymerase sigma-70 factor (ECF subfamily)
MAVSDETTASISVVRDSEGNSDETNALVRRAQTGSLPAIRELYLAYHEQIYRFIWSRVYDPAQADDLTGEVFLRMITHLGSYQDRAIPFQAWLYRIARNLIIDNHRRSLKRETIPLDHVSEDRVGAETPEKATEQALTFEEVQRGLESLNPEQREVLELRFLAGLSTDEVAAVVEKSVLAVKGLQHRGLSALRVYLQE